MGQATEWGEYFPVTISTYSYNESLAQDYYPLTKAEVEAKGWVWLDEVEKKDQYMGPKIEVPDSLDDVTDEICKQILTCDVSSKQYKIIPQELRFYRQVRLPLPRKSFFQRHKDRMAMRNPRILFQRACDQCKTSVQTTYAPTRPEKVYCEKCFQDSLQ